MQFFYGKPELKLDIALLNQYTGHYKSPTDTTVMTRKENTLYLKINPEMTLLLSAETPENFYSRGLPGRLRIDKDGKGNVTGYTVTIPNVGSMPYTKMD
jgi:hypothetical protein